jgi:hypothetical protein
MDLAHSRLEKGGFGMKKPFVMISVVIFAFVMGHHFLNRHSTEVSADEGGNPFPKGQFSVTFQGSVALCFNPSTFALESCSTAGAIVTPLSIVDNGAGTLAGTGKSCYKRTQAASTLPLNASPPDIFAYNNVGNCSIMILPAESVTDPSPLT